MADADASMSDREMSDRESSEEFRSVHSSDFFSDEVEEERNNASDSSVSPDKYTYRIALDLSKLSPDQSSKITRKVLKLIARVFPSQKMNRSEYDDPTPEWKADFREYQRSNPDPVPNYGLGTFVNPEALIGLKDFGNRIIEWRTLARLIFPARDTGNVRTRPLLKVDHVKKVQDKACAVDSINLFGYKILRYKAIDRGDEPDTGRGRGPARGRGRGPARGQGRGPARGQGREPLGLNVLYFTLQIASPSLQENSPIQPPTAVSVSASVPPPQSMEITDAFASLGGLNCSLTEGMSQGMKRGYDESTSTSFGPPQSRPRFTSFGDLHYGEDESSRHPRKVADQHGARLNQTLEEREASPIIHLKKLFNWIKSVLIQLYARAGDAVLDLDCGKGGDLIKWDKARIGYYVGIDIDEGSIKDCRTRYNGDADPQQRRKKFSFPARLICADCYNARLDCYLVDDAPFDICSCQFALHYSWSNEARVRRALANISALLRPGGTFIGTMLDASVIIKRLREAEGLDFGNSVYWVSLDEDYRDKKFPPSKPFGIKYKFHLEDAVDCSEWIVPFHIFKALAEEYDLEVVMTKNFYEFVNEYLGKPKFTELMHRLGALGDGKQDHSTLSKDEWDVAYLYLVYVLRKRGQPPTEHSKRDANKGKLHIEEDDIEFLET
ncbi:hypothetical protein LUZ61_018084 [Rhynchospora tenuis]|uniref:mRNA cap guanine-N(7) methyltransferase 1 n=1 Tax=Rhynchospora tenuis TaxID=198213 RepID=A0AAD6ELL6_9POAL|nr:hypothetical protein LUZ61_018084 [Rhynchospora tenuis]